MSENSYGSIFIFSPAVCPSVIIAHSIAHTWTHMENQTQSTDWTKYFLIKHPPFVIAGPWVSLVPALKQQLSFPLPHSSPKCFQWRRKQQLPEGCVHMKLQKRKKCDLYAVLSFFSEESCETWSALIVMLIFFFFFFAVPTNVLER